MDRKKDLWNGHVKQKEIYDSPAKIKILVCGRGFGKSRLVVYEALRSVRKANATSWIIAPTLSSVQEIYYDDIVNTLELLGWYDKTHIDKRNGIFTFTNNSKLYLKSSDKPERLRGRRCDFIALDEFAYFYNQENFKKIFLPALKPEGKMVITSTPNGYDELYKLYETGQRDKKGIWKSWRYSSEDNPTVLWGGQLELDKKSMSQSEFRQERQGMFESMANRVSIDFDRKVNGVDLPIAFKERQIRISCDFNIDPMSWIAFQVVPKELLTDYDKDNNLQNEVMCVIKDFKEKDCTTKRMIHIVKQWLTEINYNGNISFYGDASGMQRNTASEYTNWLLIENAFPNAYFNYNTSNPSIIDRINTANMKIKNANNEIGVLIDNNRALEVIKDFEQVSYKKGTMQIDKTKERIGVGHLYDAVTYAIYEMFNLNDDTDAIGSFSFDMFGITTQVVS